MKILITNHWLKKLGGSETFTYTLGAELKRLGHTVHVFTNHKGLISKKLNEIDIDSRLDDSYDLILANHHTTVDKVHGRGPIIQTCHGTIPKLEQPSHKSDDYVAISEEVQLYLSDMYYIQATVIRNGIDCDRYKPTHVVANRLKKVLSLCHTDEANNIIGHACSLLGLKFTKVNKHQQQIWNMEQVINQADLVITLGRGAYESFACGRPVVVFDKRPYQPCFADGYVNPVNINSLVTTNCSGRFLKLNMGAYELAAEFKKYDPKHSDFLRHYALDHFNIKKAVKQYLKLKPA